MRLDLQFIAQWIRSGSRVLDLGCGDGSLLEQLCSLRQIDGLGIEIDADHINTCIGKGISVVEQDLNQGLVNFRDNSFDTVVMAHALQTLRHPDLALLEMLRIGRQCVVTFPNFGHWSCRWSLTQRGRMPVSRFMPYSWYDTPNIHFCTIRDFEALCQQRNIRILDRAMISQGGLHSALAKLWPNLFAQTAVYHISK